MSVGFTIATSGERRDVLRRARERISRHDRRVRAVVLAARLAHIEQAAMHGVLAQVTMALNLAFVQDESLEHWLQV